MRVTHFGHSIWKSVLTPEDTCADLTLGGGQDALFVAPLCKQVIACDIQEEALARAQKLLKGHLSPTDYQKIAFHHTPHEVLVKTLPPASLKLAIYNLGYLPGSDKNVITQTATTLESVQGTCALIQEGGLISITCYPGHEEGLKEEEALTLYTNSLDLREWMVFTSRCTNRNKCPSLLLLFKQMKSKMSI